MSPKDEQQAWMDDTSDWAIKSRRLRLIEGGAGKERTSWLAGVYHDTKLMWDPASIDWLAVGWWASLAVLVLSVLAMCLGADLSELHIHP